MASVGKKVFEDYYLHISALRHLPAEEYRTTVQAALGKLTESEKRQVNVVKINLRSKRVSLLEYSSFDLDPFPVLVGGWIYEPKIEVVRYRTYSNSINPPILHRKELLVDLDFPMREDWILTTRAAESIGLFDDNATIGFKKNWERRIFDLGFKLQGNQFVPIGNDSSETAGTSSENGKSVQRHLTALSRATLSAPVQLLVRNGLLSAEQTFFDYGCGRGTDIFALKEAGIQAAGWDPHYAAENSLYEADVVNLGFVVNVIEDSAERVEAIHKAFKLARRVLAVAVMLHTSDPPGKPFRDGFITSRNTFQKYFSQGELKIYLEDALHQQVFMIGPGVALVFADKNLEQRFNSRKFRSNDFTQRLLAAKTIRPNVAKRTRVRIEKISRSEKQFIGAKEVLQKLWELSLDLGRYPEPIEVAFFQELLEVIQPYSRALRLLKAHFDPSLLDLASKQRASELLLYMSAQQFEKRPTYKMLETRIQRDIKFFFHDFRSAQSAGLNLLIKAADPNEVLAACDEAASKGLGWLETNQSLQFHIGILERLPVILRAYVNCGLIIWDAMSDVHLIKIHIGSGKLTLFEFKDFDSSPVPLLLKRVKINLRKQDYDVFEYGSEQYPSTVLYRKSRYMHEDMPDFAEQLAFDDALDAIDLKDRPTFGESFPDLCKKLELNRVSIEGLRLIPATSIPDLSQPCGAHFTFRDFVECGETQSQTGTSNTPLQAGTYNSLHQLAVEILDPTIDYFGAIHLTYGFCSASLSKKIPAKIAPSLDQHAAHECSQRGKPVCERLGAAVDFHIEDEDMLEVAKWIATHCRFDRIYFYGRSRPIHVSTSAAPVAQATVMLPKTSGGNAVPKTMSVAQFINFDG
jgi:DNA phosphorothioation-associated putative methyltransferase